MKTIESDDDKELEADFNKINEYDESEELNQNLSQIKNSICFWLKSFFQNI